MGVLCSTFQGVEAGKALAAVQSLCDPLDHSSLSSARNAFYFAETGIQLMSHGNAPSGALWPGDCERPPDGYKVLVPGFKNKGVETTLRKQWWLRVAVALAVCNPQGSADGYEALHDQVRRQQGRSRADHVRAPPTPTTLRIFTCVLTSTQSLPAATRTAQRSWCESCKRSASASLTAREAAPDPTASECGADMELYMHDCRQLIELGLKRWGGDAPGRLGPRVLNPDDHHDHDMIKRMFAPQPEADGTAAGSPPLQLQQQVPAGLPAPQLPAPPSSTTGEARVPLSPAATAAAQPPAPQPPTSVRQAGGRVVSSVLFGPGTSRYYQSYLTPKQEQALLKWCRYDVRFQIYQLHEPAARQGRRAAPQGAEGRVLPPRRARPPPALQVDAAQRL